MQQMNEMILVVCKHVTTCLELPNANTALDAETWDWLLLTCVQTGFPVQIPEPVKACHRLYFEIRCLIFSPNFRQMSWLFPQCFKYGLCTSRKVLFRCYEHAVYDCAFRQLSSQTHTQWIKEMNHSWNNFKQCMCLIVFSIFCLDLTQSLSEQAAVI